MRYSNFITATSLILFSRMASAKDSLCTDEYRAKVVQNYVAIWKGDFATANSTLSPKLHVYTDRFPNPSGEGSIPFNITTKDEFLGWVTASRQGFEKYGFEPHYWFGSGEHIAIRWWLDGIIGDFNKFPITLKPGDPVTYNGTDLLTLDPITGLITRIDSSGEVITLFHNLGIEKLTA